MKYITAGYVLFLLVLDILASQDIRPWHDLLFSVPFSDKLAHFLLIGILALLLNATLRHARFQVGPLKILKGSLIVIVLVTLAEFSQILVPMRTFSITDLFCGYAGVLCLGQAVNLLALITNRLSSPFIDA